MLTIKHIALTALIVLLAAPFVSAQDDSVSTGWKKSLMVDFTATQTAYSDSWVGGELGALSWVSNLNFTAEKQLTPSFDFKSTLRMSFGQTHTQRFDTVSQSKVWDKPHKSTDLIDWENVGRLTRGWVVDPYVAFRLESQFLDASFEPKNRYLNPIKLTESAGIARKLYAKNDNEIISRLGFAVRQIFNNVIIDETPPYKDSTIMQTDGGIESVSDVKFALRGNVQYMGKLTLYKAFFFSKKDEVKGTPYENYWKAVDVNFENMVTANITKVIAVNLYVQFLYDKEVVDRGRLKETMGIGFTFKLM